MWYVILEHDYKNVRAELLWRLLIVTIKTPILISQSKFYFHVQRSLKHTIIYTYVTGSGKRYIVAHTMIFLCISVVVLKPVIFFIH